ncbi:hypothetical protein [Nocardia puris]|uniref:Uncharacterized protein n=1 Tax=Nocardia puris TaxID=208602 RepID=A0A366DBY4_9NOCA|nr:hypothetical protein [Nocardia puris]RBO87019.1 hypothetical protein DFR74_112196 [Nocardia puris]
MHPVFYQGADQLTMLTAILDAFPGQNDGVLVPIHPRVREKWARALLRRGVRLHPDAMEELPIASTDHPEAGWLAPQTWVSRAKYEAAHQATADAATTQGAAAAPTGDARTAEQLRQMLAAVDPAMERRITTTTDPELRAQMAAEAAAAIPEYLAAIRDLTNKAEAARQKEAADDMEG